jgi:hypothetical protein
MQAAVQGDSQERQLIEENAGNSKTSIHVPAR